MTVIVNPASGTGEKRANLERALAEAGIRARIVPARDHAAMRKAALGAAAAGEPVVAAAGGDGTTSAVAGALAGTPAALGVLPAGTLNHFAKDAGIPILLDAAAKTLVAGRAARVDVASVNGRVFINNSSLGLYPFLVRRREERQRRGSGKWRAAAAAFLEAMRLYPRLTVRVEAEGRVLERTSSLVFIGNNVYGLEGSRASLTSGVLCICLPRSEGRLGLLAAAAGNFDVLVTREARIFTRSQRVRVACDGEAELMPAPLAYEIRPLALRVMVPQSQ